ncbi:MAG TPA: SDR family oxidoreductase [Hyphomicrobiales bacterium]|nr:SDR family oxidoreductase [Hyphomicrobiales bacterium]
MKIDLAGKTALVTGSTMGIGRAIAKGLAGAGASVVVNGRDAKTVDAAVAALKGETGGTLRGVAADVGTAEGCAALAKAVPAVDILVSNAAFFAIKDFFDQPDEDWQRYFEVNVMAGVRLSRAYLKGMLERDWGRVVFISSESAISIPPGMISYGFTKAAELAVSRGLAKLTRGTGVTVNAVLPGPTMTERFAARMAERGAKEGKSAEEVGREFVMAQRPSSILGRMATPEEVANMVVYACSAQASATNGATLRVEGGIIDTIG